MPLAEAGELTGQQQALADQLHAFAVPWAERAGFAGTTEEGHLIGPWNAQVHRPGPAAGFSQWILADQQDSTLSPRVREAVILTVAIAWQSVYEIYSHVAGRDHHRGGQDIDRDPVPELQTPGQVHPATVAAAAAGPRQTVVGYGVARAPTRGGRPAQQGHCP